MLQYGAAAMKTIATASLSYLQAIVIGILQGITELFPISSLGHSVLVPELLGWHSLVAGQSADESFYLAFLVGLALRHGDRADHLLLA